MTNGTDWLPELVLLEDYGGNWEAYLNRIYQIFKNDFVDSKPIYPGKRMSLKRHPLTKGKEATFWHFIQAGPNEDDRIPDLRRCERIPWPRPIIEGFQSDKVCAWKTRRNTHRRIVIALKDFSYVVVLEEREDYVLPWTAYYVEQRHRRAKLEKEFLTTKKTDTAS